LRCVQLDEGPEEQLEDHGNDCAGQREVSMSSHRKHPDILKTMTTLFLVAGTVSAGFADELTDLEADYKDVEQKVVAILHMIENSEEVQRLKTDLEATRKAQRAAGEKLPKAQETIRQRKEMEKERKTLLEKRNSLSEKHGGELGKTALALKETEKALSAALKARRASDSNADVDAALKAQKQAASAHAEAESGIPEIREVDEKVKSLDGKIWKAIKDAEKLMVEHPDMQEFNKKRLRLETELKTARRAETPELKELRARQDALKSRIAELRAEQAREKGTNN